MIDNYLSDESIKKHGLYDPHYMRGKIQQDRAGKEDNAHLIWQLLTNEVWFRAFFLRGAEKLRMERSVEAGWWFEHVVPKGTYFYSGD